MKTFLVGQHEAAARQESEFATALDRWVKTCSKLIADDWAAKGYTFAPAPHLEISEGDRYFRVWKQETNHDGSKRGNTIFAFVDKTNGDILKPAGRNAPAKHVRGNLFDDKQGMGSMTAYGPAYLR